MPELPEVETVRRSLAPHILHKKIATVTAPPSKVLRPSLEAVSTVLTDHAFTAIDRIGKLLIFSLDVPDSFLLIHLKMTGQLVYVVERERIGGGHSLTHADMTTLPHRHTRAVIAFEDGSTLYFNDMRLFGYIEYADSARVAKAKKGFGPELLDATLDIDALIATCKKRQTTIKAVLLNQSIIAGIGNIYADEMCYAAGIRPSRRANTLTVAEYRRLFAAGATILQKSIDNRGTTFNHFVDGTGTRGNFLSHLQVYGRGGEPCLRCHTTLLKKTIAGRGTVYCPRCQK